ncbi:hypothetical protein [Gluconacetobacter entanii]|uniref:hypothetical protein n=1 Tax=Gluconacetobacter entanii TaxID=108528 RepID=UPI0011B74FE6|nr:hypothetical protein [Gluconacetobacter entanii]MCE2578368.1 hypothetical protein [Komagataeibacter sp. FNDCR1]
MSIKTVALIGSFRKENYPKVIKTLTTFKTAGLNVSSPSGAEIVSGTEFVRFETDLAEMTDAEIQTATLERIFSADVVYVVTGENGYVGKTTCYEVGRIIQRKQPIYFFEHPNDLPVHIPAVNVAPPDEFVIRFVEKLEKPSWLYQSDVGEIFDGERRLTSACPQK